MSRSKRLAVLAISVAVVFGSLSLPASGDLPVITTTKPHTGNYSLEICVSVSCFDYAIQYVELPANVTGGEASIWYWGSTSDGEIDCSDAAVIQLSETALVEQPEVVQIGTCEDGADNQWHQAVDSMETSQFLVDHAGEVIAVVAIGVTNNGQTSWFLDDASLKIETSAGASALAPTEILCDPGFELGPDNSCWLEVSQDQTGGKQLVVAKAGNGSGTVTDTTKISCGNNCTGYYPTGGTATLKANPAAGSVFTGWGGACSGTGICEVTMDTNKQVTANFSRATTHARGVTLQLEQHLVAKGKVTAGGYGPCFKKVNVTIQRLRAGKWRNVKTDETNKNGVFGIFISDKPGKYRARASKFIANNANVCGLKTSKTRTHKHN